MIDTGTDHCLATESGGIAVITLNRPQARNAMSMEMLEGLATALDHCERSPEVKCLVITGAGSAFCAGGDVKGMAAAPIGGGDGPTLDESIHAQRLSQRNTAGRLYTMPKPVVAMIPGPAAGAGLSLALAADLRYMADDTFVTSAFARVGFSGDYGGTYFLSQLVGQAKAREIYFLSDRIPAADCESLGIINQAVPAEELEATTMAVARRLASGPPVAYRYMKENFNRALAGELTECLDLEATHHIHAALTEDHREAAQAFVEKREPVFVGR